MMTGLLAGKTLEEAEELADGFRELMYGKSPPEGHLEVLGELEALQAVRRFPVRIKCALLAWTALEEGIGAYRVAKKMRRSRCDGWVALTQPRSLPRKSIPKPRCLGKSPLRPA